MSTLETLEQDIRKSLPLNTDPAATANHVAKWLHNDGYRKPRVITTAAELDDLPFGSAVQTSDSSDTVVLKCEGGFFRNQSGFTISVPILWRWGAKPFTVLFEAQA